MAEGGRFPWKVQTIFSRGPVADYSNLRNPLPRPPGGQKWEQDKATREWQLVSEGTYDSSEEESSHHSSLVVAPIKQEGEDRRLDADDGEEGEDDWEEVKGVGSVRSMSSHTSVAAQDGSSNRSNKLQRTHSSSTIDSNDLDRLGPSSGKGVLGVDYVEHVVLPTDTFQGICLAYKIHPTKLRQANHFSGCSLLMAPKKLVIPVSKKALRSGFMRCQDTASKEYKLHALQAEIGELSVAEARAYLELSDWDLKDAIQSANEDNEWERDVGPAKLQAGQIRITVTKSKKGLISCCKTRLQGAGIQPKRDSTSGMAKSAGDDGKDQEKVVERPAPQKLQRQPIIREEDLPAIATKTVKPQDLYRAAPQHDSFGVELQSLTQPLLAENMPAEVAEDVASGVNSAPKN